MKKQLILLIALLISQLNFGQLTLSSQNNGVVDVSYGDNNDYSIYDPSGDQQIYIYMWIDPNQTEPNLSNQYNDDWNDASGLVILNYDSNLQKFTGTIDFNTHNFSGEGVIPAQTQINDFNLILRNEAGDRQSGNLLASNYGFQPTNSIETLQSSDVFILKNKQLFINVPDGQKINNIGIYNIKGQLIKSVPANTKSIDLSFINNQIIIVDLLFSSNQNAVVKIRL
jgi:hypothetical protein